MSAQYVSSLLYAGFPGDGTNEWEELLIHFIYLKTIQFGENALMYSTCIAY